MDLKDLEKLLKLLHKHNIKAYSTPQLTLSLGDAPTPSKTSLVQEAPKSEEETYSEEELLLWSTPSL